jgi:hypothetical protein
MKELNEQQQQQQQQPVTLNHHIVVTTTRAAFCSFNHNPVVLTCESIKYMG